MMREVKGAKMNTTNYSPQGAGTGNLRTGTMIRGTWEFLLGRKTNQS